MTKTILLYFPKLESGPSQPRTPPLPLLAISSLLVKEGYDIKIFDALADKEAKEKLLNQVDNALCIGMSVWVGYPITDALGLSIKIKQKRPDVPVVWGGWHPSLFPEQTIENPNIDFVVCGQGESTFYELVKCLDDKTSPEKVLGITYKSKDRIIINPPRERTPLDNLPPFPFHLIDLEKYVSPRLTERTMGYNSSLGCPFNCAFCADSTVYGRRRSDIPAERVLEDIKMFIEKYNVDGIWFDDTNFLINKKKLMAICKGIIKNKWKIKWQACERVDHFLTFTEEELNIIKSSGCALLTVGAESGSQKMLDTINKEIKVEDVIKFSRLCAKYDIAIKYDFMVGLPGETKKDFIETLNLIKKVYNSNDNNELAIFFYSPYPGTPLYHKLVKEGQFDPPKSLEEWAEFDPMKIKTPWIREERKEELRTFLFYLQLAYPKRHIKPLINNSSYRRVYPIIQKIAKFRMNYNILACPIERKLHKLSKIILDKSS